MSILDLLRGQAGENVTLQRSSGTLRVHLASFRGRGGEQDTIAGEVANGVLRLLCLPDVDLHDNDIIIRSDNTQWQVVGPGMMLGGGRYREYSVRSY